MSAALDYKKFPVNGLISFYMDDVNTFTEKKREVFLDILNLNILFKDAQNVLEVQVVKECPRIWARRLILEASLKKSGS